MGSDNNKFTVDFHPLHRNTLRGFARVEIAELKLEIGDIAVHEKGAARWAQLPAKPQIRDGALVVDETTGKIAYKPVMQFTRRAVADAFSARVIDAVLGAFPAALDCGDGK
jgi:hypothetical protein